MRDLINYRQVKHDDIENILDLMKEFYKEEDISINIDSLKKTLLQFLSSTEYGYALFLTYNQLIVGYLVMTNGFSFEFGGKYQFIDELFVAEKFRRKGIASFALNLVKELAALEQVRALHLEVAESNKPASLLYQTNNFLGTKRVLLSCKID